MTRLVLKFKQPRTGFMKLQHEKNSNLDMGPAYPSPSLWQDLNYTTCGLVDPANLTVCITCDCFKIRLLIAFGLDLKNDEVAKRTLLFSLKGFSNLFLLFPSHRRIMGEQEREVNFTCLTSDEQFSFFLSGHLRKTWEGKMVKGQTNKNTQGRDRLLVSFLPARLTCWCKCIPC